MKIAGNLFYHFNTLRINDLPLQVYLNEGRPRGGCIVSTSRCSRDTDKVSTTGMETVTLVNSTANFSKLLSMGRGGLRDLNEHKKLVPTRSNQRQK